MRLEQTEREIELNLNEDWIVGDLARWRMSKCNRISKFSTTLIDRTNNCDERTRDPQAASSQAGRALDKRQSSTREGKTKPMCGLHGAGTRQLGGVEKVSLAQDASRPKSRT
jgi:hypothetical protein